MQIPEATRLYGLPFAENLRFDPAEVVEEWLTDNEMVTEPFVIEEWSVHSPQHHMPDTDRVLEWIEEWVGENGEWYDDPSLTWGGALGDDDVRAAASSLLDLIASKVAARCADEHLRDLTVTPSDDPQNPLLDGVPTWRRADADS